ncbi:MAG: dctQ [Gammaproteobacteria bacterium]|nr:MAG: dctQ [Gammaproteobacteria bacterium]TND02215.1 MAG: dctQ [Gammaproteobacteria bacterium]
MITANKITPHNSGLLSRAARAIAAVEDGVLVLVVGIMIVLAASQIFLRNVLDSGFSWGDPLLRILVLWVGLVGAMVATREDNQITIDILSRFLPEKIRLLSRAITDLFASLVCAILTYHGGRFVWMDWADGAIAFANIPAWACEIVIPIGFGAIALRYALLSLSRLKHLSPIRS